MLIVIYNSYVSGFLWSAITSLQTKSRLTKNWELVKDITNDFKGEWTVCYLYDQLLTSGSYFGLTKFKGKLYFLIRSNKIIVILSCKQYQCS